MLAFSTILLSGFLVQGSVHDCPAYPESRWSFNPDTLEEKADFQVNATGLLAGVLPPVQAVGAPPRQNFVDDHIFDRLESERVQSAPLSSDEEFARRVTLDLTGRIPDLERLQQFLADRTSDKRTALIDELMASEAFVDRWTFWLGELTRNTASYYTVTRQGRNAMHFYLRNAVENGTPLNRVVTDLITARGRTTESGPPNYITRNLTLGDPRQDFWDDLTANSMSQFLGITSLCVSCHDGARHLEAINTYLSQRKRREFWRQSAFFSRMSVVSFPINPNGNTNAYEVEDKQMGAYYANVGGNLGPRPLRSGGPYYPTFMLTGARPANGNYRLELARILTSDIQFGRNILNRLWEHFMGVGIVDPVDGFDLARYETQASHPRLLDALARDFIENGYDLRHAVRRIVTSAAYQLSVRYPAEWQDRYRRLFARHLARRLDAEEIHDSITQANGVTAVYSIEGFDRPVTRAMQFPDIDEPRARGDVSSFLNLFGRGNRNDTLRTTVSSILGSLSAMNATFITDKVLAQNNNGVARALSMDLPDAQLVERLFLQTLGRKPTPDELNIALSRRGRTRTEWAEDLQWVLFNKLDFYFNY